MELAGLEPATSWVRCGAPVAAFRQRPLRQSFGAISGAVSAGNARRNALKAEAPVSRLPARKRFPRRGEPNRAVADAVVEEAFELVLHAGTELALVAFGPEVLGERGEPPTASGIRWSSSYCPRVLSLKP